ncbi:hypothetical protein [Paenibacillus hamazuiensis]|uniref:hypothetical protein n=1 Tax=Paenibacillus hamazuiensis TaxID=2936508 RepID=UPI0020104A74|nr:hypothetical protein [Paenibacillus hamazuiensis]
MESQVQTDWSQNKAAAAADHSNGISPNLKTGMQALWVKLAFWMKVTAFLYLGFGVFQVLLGFVQFGFGTVVGVIQIILFVVLIRLTGQVKEMPNRSDENSLFLLNQRLVVYFRMQALQIAGLFLSVVILAVTVIQFLTKWEWLIQLIKWGKKLGGLLKLVETLLVYIKDWFT